MSLQDSDEDVWISAYDTQTESTSIGTLLSPHTNKTDTDFTEKITCTCEFSATCRAHPSEHPSISDRIVVGVDTFQSSCEEKDTSTFFTPVHVQPTVFGECTQSQEAELGSERSTVHEETRLIQLSLSSLKISQNISPSDAVAKSEDKNERCITQANELEKNELKNSQEQMGLPKLDYIPVIPDTPDQVVPFPIVEEEIISLRDNVVEDAIIEEEVIHEVLDGGVNDFYDTLLKPSHEIVSLSDPMGLQPGTFMESSLSEDEMTDAHFSSFEEIIDTGYKSIKHESCQPERHSEHSKICWENIKEKQNHCCISVSVLSAYAGVSNCESSVVVEDMESGDKECEHDMSSEMSQMNNDIGTSSEATCDKMDDPDEINESLFDSLPEEIITKIFSFIPHLELFKCVNLVCKKWNTAAKNPLLWQAITFEEFQQMPSATLLYILYNFCPLLKTLSLRCRRDILLYDFQLLTESCPLLQELSLAFCDQVNENIIREVGKGFLNLRLLNVEGCELHDECLYMLGNLPLEVLNVSHCTNLSDDGLIYVAKTFKNLHTLNIDGVQWITDPAVQILVDYCHQSLQHVWLDGANLSDGSLQMLTKCSKLQTLKLSFCDEFSDKALTWISNMKNLKSLGLKKGVQFSAAGLVEMFKSLDTSVTGNPTGLVHLNMTECAALDNYCLCILANSCRHLQSINLSWCWEITDDGIVHLINNCHDLIWINFCGLHGILGVPLQDIPVKLPNLILLDLTQCNRVSDDFLVQLVTKMSSLVVYDYYGEQVKPEL